jgi:hypothetical protein
MCRTTGDDPLAQRRSCCGLERGDEEWRALSKESGKAGSGARAE